MSKKVYIIDLENIGSTATAAVINNTLSDKSNCVIVCYSSSTCEPQTILNMIDCKIGNRVLFQRCVTGKRDEMDIQLAALVGNLCARYPKRQFVIVSDDSGYCSAIEFLQQQGYHVFRNKVSNLVRRADIIKLPTARSKECCITNDEIPTAFTKRLRNVCANSTRLVDEYDNIIGMVKECECKKELLYPKLHTEYPKDYSHLKALVKARLKR